TPLLWQETTSRVQLSSSTADGDRTTTSTFALAADASNYRLRPLVTTRQVQQAGQAMTYARSEQQWDPSYRVVKDDLVSIDGTATNNAITHRLYDLTTGNVLKVWKPVQWALSMNESTNTAYTICDYDARKLFAASETSVPT